MASLPRVGLIGAGVSGLTAGKALKDKGIPYRCFDASDDIGGNWYFGNPNGRSSAYRSLHIDISKPSISFADFPLSDSYPDFPHHAQIFEYLQDYTERFGLRESISFQTEVSKAERLEGGGWKLTLADGEEDRFDALLVANGHHWDPLMPDPPFPGSFDGDEIHSHHYIDPTDPLDLRDKRVLVVGIGNSAVDITSELSRKGVAEKVFISTRSGAYVVPKYVFGKPLDQVVKTNPKVSLKLQRKLAQPLARIVSGKMENFGLPTPNHRFLEAHPTVSSELLLRLGSGDAIAKRNVAELLGDRVRFDDGTVEEVDAIIYATGYKITFPFFDPDFISAPNNHLPLWKRMFKPGIDDLAFVGLAQAIPTLFPFAELQSKWLSTWLAGEWDPPAKAAMEAQIQDDEKRYTSHYNQRPRHTMQHDFYVYEYELERDWMPAGRARAAARGGASPLAGRVEAADSAAATS